jgi:hypothetical protein
VLVPATSDLRGSNGNQVRFNQLGCSKLGVGAAYMLAAQLGRHGEVHSLELGTDSVPQDSQNCMQLPKHIRRKLGSTAQKAQCTRPGQPSHVGSTSAPGMSGSLGIRNVERFGLGGATAVLDTSSPNGFSSNGCTLVRSACMPRREQMIMCPVSRLYSWCCIAGRLSDNVTAQASVHFSGCPDAFAPARHMDGNVKSAMRRMSRTRSCRVHTAHAALPLHSMRSGRPSHTEAYCRKIVLTRYKAATLLLN